MCGRTKCVGRYDVIVTGFKLGVRSLRRYIASSDVNIVNRIPVDVKYYLRKHRNV